MKTTIHAGLWPSMSSSCVTFWRGSMPPGRSPDMDLPGFRLHPLKGELKGFHGVTVRANWRVIFRFADRDAFDLDYLDYH
jgi:proteic killer suppression protein